MLALQRLAYRSGCFLGDLKRMNDVPVGMTWAISKVGKGVLLLIAERFCRMKMCTITRESLGDLGISGYRIR